MPTPDGFQLGILPERKLDRRALAASYGLLILLIIVMINIGSGRDAITARHAGDEGRLENRPPSVSSSDNFRPYGDSGSLDLQARRSLSTGGAGVHRVQGGDSKKSEKARDSTQSEKASDNTESESEKAGDSKKPEKTAKKDKKSR